MLLLAPKLAPKNINPYKSITYRGFSREEGIRTLDTVTRILTFQASSFNHSDTSLIQFANIGIFLKYRNCYASNFIKT